MINNKTRLVSILPYTIILVITDKTVINHDSLTESTINGAPDSRSLMTRLVLPEAAASLNL